MRQFVVVLLLTFTFFQFCSSVFASDIDIGSSKIYPASPFYFLKTVRENIEMHLAQTPRVKMIRQLEFATRRLREVSSLVSAKREDLISATLERYWFHIHSLPDKNPEHLDIAARVKEDLGVDLQFLQRIYPQLSTPTAKMFVRSTINKILQRDDVTGDSRKLGCSFLVNEASSSALNEVERAILTERAQKCLKI